VKLLKGFLEDSAEVAAGMLTVLLCLLIEVLAVLLLIPLILVGAMCAPFVIVWSLMRDDDSVREECREK
jgi:hypothetical protein